MNFPPEMIRDIRRAAMDSLQDFCECHKVGGMNEDSGEVNYMPLIPLTIMIHEVINAWAGMGHTIEGKSLEDIEGHLNDICKAAIPIALEHAKQMQADTDEPEPQDPVDVVDEIIKQAQQNADS